MWDNNLGSLLRSDYCWGDGGEIEVHPLSGEVVQAKGPKMRVWRLEVFHPKLELTSKKIYADVSRFLGEPWWFARNRSASDGWCLEILDLRKKDYNTSPSFLLPCGKNHSQSLLTQDGSWLVMAGGEDSRTVDVWRREGESYSQIASWKADVVLERIACLSPKGERFWGGKALYETLTGKRLFAVDHDDISGFRGVTLLWGGQRLFGKVLFGGKNHPEKPGIALWDAASGRRMATEFSSVALTIGVTEDGGLLAEGGADKKIRIRSGETLKVEREFRAHDGVVTGVLWHPKRPLLVRVSEDLTIKFWDRASWQVVEEIRGLSSVPEEMSVSSDGLALSVFFKRESKTRIYEPVSFRGEGK
jgi:WD40 repeat protein